MGMRGKANPLFKPSALRRTATTGLAGLALALLSAPPASAAEPLVVSTSLAIVEAEPGQPVAVETKTMDFKLRKAALLAMPLQLGTANEAVERFEQQSPIQLGTVDVGSTTFSGGDIAEAAAPRLERIGLPADKVDDVRFHFNNLVSLGNSVTVNVPEPDPAEPPSEEQPAPPPEESSPPPPESTSAQPAPAPDAGAPPAHAPAPSLPPSARSAPRAMSVLPPSLRSAAELPWANSSYGQIPGSAPSVGDLAKQAEQQQREQDRQEEIRAAGSAEAMPAEASEKVALPVLLAAISLAVVTAALVRSWVLRRQ